MWVGKGWGSYWFCWWERENECLNRIEETVVGALHEVETWYTCDMALIQQYYINFIVRAVI